MSMSSGRQTTVTRTRSAGTGRSLVAGSILSLAIAGPFPAAAGPARGVHHGAPGSCLITHHLHTVQFSAMQRGLRSNPAADFATYCQEIPNVGETFLTIDLLDRRTRQLPVSIRVVEETARSDPGSPAREPRTLTEIPRRVYRNGTLETRVDIAHRGHYALILNFGDKPSADRDELRIPFSVALPGPARTESWLPPFAWTLLTVFFGAMGVIGGFRTLLAPLPGPSETPAGTSSGRLPTG